MRIPIDPLTFLPLFTGIFKLWVKTLRFEVRGDWEKLVSANLSGKPYVVALWHSDLFSIIGFGYNIGLKFAGLVSQSKDGEIVAQLLKSLGHTAVRGSSSRGGVKALLQLKRIMERENKIGAFAADGPRGPRNKVKDGVIFMAHRAEAEIITTRAYPKWKKVFNSWDRFALPLPFSKCVIHVGAPMAVAGDKLDREVLAMEKERLNKLLNSLGADENQ